MTKSTYSQIARKPATERTPAETDAIRAVWRAKMAKRRAGNGSGTHPAVRQSPASPLDALAETLFVLLCTHGTIDVVRMLEAAMLARTSEEPLARVREQLLEETRLVSRLVGTLEPEVTSAPSHAPAERSVPPESGVVDGRRRKQTNHGSP